MQSSSEFSPHVNRPNVVSISKYQTIFVLYALRNVNLDFVHACRRWGVGIWTGLGWPWIETDDGRL